MSEIVLIDEFQNPNGRWLVQDGTNLYVLTRCCKAKFSMFTDAKGVTWTQCVNCETTLERNDGGWSSEVDRIDLWGKHVPTGISEWGKYWFGLLDFKITVTLS